MAEAAKIRAEAHRAQLDAMSKHARVEQLESQLRQLTRQKELPELSRRSEGAQEPDALSVPATTSAPEADDAR